MRTTTWITCLECGHDHELEVIRGEYASDDYAEAPEVCEVCGAAFDAAPSVDDRRAERQQMGITD